MKYTSSSHIVLFVLILLSCQSYLAQPLSDTPLIQARGSAIIYTQPDEVLFQFSIYTEGADLADAREQNRVQTAEAITFLQDAGILPQHIQTQYLSVGVRFRDKFRKTETRYFEARQNLNVCLKDISRYEEVMMGLLLLDIDNLSSPTFRTTQYREVMDEARKKAIQAAREKAVLMSAELGQSIGAAHTVSEVDQYNRWGMNQNAYANTASEGSASGSDLENGFATGQLEIKATVDVHFTLLSE